MTDVPDGTADPASQSAEDHRVASAHDAPEGARVDARAERRARIRHAAYQAEFHTGRRERTEVEARRNIFFRLVVIVVGSVLVILGLLMLVFPGPGILVTLVGLGLLAREFVWADRLMRTLRAKSHVDEIGRLPIWAQISLGVVSIAAVVASGIFVLVR